MISGGGGVRVGGGGEYEEIYSCLDISSYTLKIFQLFCSSHLAKMENLYG